MFGSNEFGQLGNGTTEDEMLPMKLSIPYQRAQKIACGNYYTLVLTEEGHIYGFGSNHSGQLGIGNKKSINLPTKTLTADDTVITNITAGYHSAAISPRGELYVWGECALGTFTSPQKISWNKTEIAAVQMGKNFTMILDKKGYIWGFGDNMMGGLGQGDVEERDSIVLIEDLNTTKIKNFACGKEFVFAISDTNNEPKKPKEEIRIEREVKEYSQHHQHSRTSPKQQNSSPKDRYRLEMSEDEIEEDTSDNKNEPNISDLESVSDRFIKAPRGSAKAIQEREAKVMMDLAAHYTSPNNVRYQKLANGREDWKELETY